MAGPPCFGPVSPHGGGRGRQNKARTAGEGSGRPTSGVRARGCGRRGLRDGRRPHPTFPSSRRWREDGVRSRSPGGGAAHGRARRAQRGGAHRAGGDEGGGRGGGAIAACRRGRGDPPQEGGRGLGMPAPPPARPRRKRDRPRYRGGGGGSGRDHRRGHGAVLRSFSLAADYPRPAGAGPACLRRSAAGAVHQHRCGGRDRCRQPPRRRAAGRLLRHHRPPAGGSCFGGAAAGARHGRRAPRRTGGWMPPSARRSWNGWRSPGCRRRNAMWCWRISTCPATPEALAKGVKDPLLAARIYAAAAAASRRALRGGAGVPGRPCAGAAPGCAGGGGDRTPARRLTQENTALYPAALEVRAMKIRNSLKSAKTARQELHGGAPPRPRLCAEQEESALQGPSARAEAGACRHGPPPPVAPPTPLPAARGAPKVGDVSCVARRLASGAAAGGGAPAMPAREREVALPLGQRGSGRDMPRAAGEAGNRPCRDSQPPRQQGG